MKFEEIKELLEFIDKSSLSYLEIKESDFYIKLDKSLNRNINKSQEPVKEKIESTHNIETNIDTNKIIDKNNDKVEVHNEMAESGELILSPMVGTFYLKSAPDKEEFIKMGEKVNKGDVICIIEAMKLMNEIECEFNGEILDILVKDGEMVEYGQPLFKIKK